MKPDIHSPNHAPISRTTLASLMACTALLAACGGGGNTTPSTEPESADFPSEEKTVALHAESDEATVLAAATNGTWVRMTQEARSFTVDRPSLVRFGVGTTWVYKSVETGGHCSAGFFGE